MTVSTRGIKFAPKSTGSRVSMKARVPIRTGGSSKGSTLTHGGEFGMRAKKGHRLTAKQLEQCYNILKRKTKVHKGAEIIMRVFPDRPVCVKVCDGASADRREGEEDVSSS
jgi:ribosomal protein L16/L10AE